MRNKLGFTLIELLIVVVIIGILAAIAIPKFGATKDKAYVAAVKSDLRNLSTAEESYFADNVYYTATLPTTSFSSSAGVIVTITTSASTTGWAATAYHTSLPTKPCATFAGAGTTPGAPTPTIEGEIKCTP